ncbi:MAG: mobile mystery protein B [Sulfuricaulis sp.]|nr:mobile mystery protein B [Sulfuricaulis sp.]
MSEMRAAGATPLDPDEAEGLIPTHVTTREELNRLEQENIVKALQWLSTSRPRSILDEAFIRKLHRQMFGSVWKWAGKFRTSDKNIGVPKSHIGVELHKLCEDTKSRIEHASYPPDEIAWRFHHRLVSIHPFPNGNGRHARLATDLLLEKLLHRPPFTWGGMSGVPQGEVRAAYLDALRAADKGNYGKLAEFVRGN